MIDTSKLLGGEVVGQGNWQGSLTGLFTQRVVGAGLVQLGPDVASDGAIGLPQVIDTVELLSAQAVGRVGEEASQLGPGTGSEGVIGLSNVMDSAKVMICSPLPVAYD